jgi:Ran GTPase-activating protein (RanGAP) involved in mRNA processing and transport
VNLEYLEIKGNLGVKEANYLRDFLKKSTSIKTLILKSNKLKVEGAQIIADGLKENSSLEVLDISSNIIRDKGANFLTQAILGENS